MKQTLQDILLVSDLDGTLIGKNFLVPQRNFDAIERFKQKGGHFAIATGRTIDSAEIYVDLAKPNTPSVILNGVMVYDYQNQKPLWEHPLPAVAAEYIKDMSTRFPYMGVEICTEVAINIVSCNKYVEQHVSHEHIKSMRRPLDFVEGTWYKAFFAMESDLLVRVKEYVDSIPHPGVRFVRSSNNYLEMLPEGIDKGVALKKLMEIMGFSLKNTYAIGDYYNDIELLAAAGVSVCPDNAPGDIKSRADLVVCHCHDGAVADLIEYIEKKVEG